MERATETVKGGGWIARPVLAAVGMALAVAGALPMFGGWSAGADQLLPSPGGLLTGPFRMPTSTTSSTSSTSTSVPATTTSTTAVPASTSTVPATTSTVPATTSTSTSTTTVAPAGVSIVFQAVPGQGGDTIAVPLAGAVFAVAGDASCTTDASGACHLTGAAVGPQLCWQETTPPSGWLAAAPACIATGPRTEMGITVVATQLPVPAPIAGRATDAVTGAAVAGSTYDLFRVDPSAPGAEGPPGAHGVLVWVARTTGGPGGAVLWPPQQINAVYCAQGVTAAPGYRLDSGQHCLAGPLAAGGEAIIDLPAQSIPRTSAPAAPSLPPDQTVPITVPAEPAAPTPDASTTPSPPAVAAVVPVASPSTAGGSLPLTGSATRVLARSGTGLIVVGVALVLASHRRRPSPPRPRSGPRVRAGSP